MTDDLDLPPWQRVWREGIAPQLTPARLGALREALATDDSRLIQGVTISPPALECVRDWPVEGCCALIGRRKPFRANLKDMP